MRLNCFYRPLFAVALLWLAGCASAPPAPQVIPPRPERAGILSFAMTARVAISQSQRAETLRMAWEHSPAHDAMGFENSLGMIVAELQRDAMGARWLTAAGERYESRNADELMSRLTHQPVPVQSLSLWVLGRVSRTGLAQYDPQGRLLEGRDGAWVVRVPEYESERAEALPRIVEVETPGLRIRLVIETWLL